MVTSPEASRSRGEEICAGRCVCLHAFSQWATLALESLLLHHGLLSAPLSFLEKKEAEGGERVREALRRAMKGRRHEDVSEILLCFGASPLLVQRVYRLPVSVCCEEKEEKNEEVKEEGEEESSRCGSPCAALNAAEQRKINRRLFTMFPPESSSGKTQRVYIVVRGSERLLSEEVTEVEGVSRAKEGVITLQWTHIGCGRRMRQEEEVKRDEQSIHMRLRQFM